MSISLSREDPSLDLRVLTLGLLLGRRKGLLGVGELGFGERVTDRIQQGL